MTKEKLIEKILKECEQDGEPVTREEAENMAEMEIKANGIKRYEQSDKPRKPAKRERKPDEVKREIISTIAQNLDRAVFENISDEIQNIKITKAEREISFSVGSDEYTVTLVKHRPKKE